MGSHTQSVLLSVLHFFSSFLKKKSSYLEEWLIVAAVFSHPIIDILKDCPSDMAV